MSGFPHFKVLPAPQQELWAELVDATDEGFVLYGGTAVALYLGHRQSVDFDFFTDKSFDPDDLYRRLPFLGGAEVLDSRPNTLTVLLHRGPQPEDTVKISLFGGFAFGRVGIPKQTPDEVIIVASEIDLLGHKLKVLMQRVEVKDYLDIDALLSSGLDLAEGLSAAQALFPAFSPAEGLKALTYFASKELTTLDAGVKKRLVAAARAVTSLPLLPVLSKTLGGRSVCGHGGASPQPSDDDGEILR